MFNKGEYVCIDNGIYGYVSEVVGNLVLVRSADYASTIAVEESMLHAAVDPNQTTIKDLYDGFGSQYERDIAEHYVNEIASALEVNENWHALKSCWLENGRSDELRKLLMKIFRENVSFYYTEECE